MSNTSKPKLSIITPEFQAFGVNLAEARKPEGFANAKAKFGLSIPLSRADAAPIMQQLRDLAKQSFPNMDEQGRVTRPNGDVVTVRLPVTTGEEINARRTAAGKKTYDYLAEKIVFKASADEGRQPGICDADGRPVAPGKIHGGDTLRAALGFLGVDVPGSFIGIACYLNGVFLVKSAEGRDVAGMFQEFISKQNDVNPFAGVDPFGGL